MAIIWRGLLFFIVGLAFGLRHSGLQGQRVTDALAWILRRLGLESGDGKLFNVCNYVDDIGGVEGKKSWASEAFNALGNLLIDLGLDESTKKAEPPATVITYLGVQFDSTKMEMSVPPDKLAEIKEEIRRWEKKTTITKKELQSIFGKLFWVAKVVRFARPLMGRLLQQFLFIVVSKKFVPVLRKIDTKKNEIADFLSRRYDEEGARSVFSKFGLKNMVKISLLF